MRRRSRVLHTRGTVRTSRVSPPPWWRTFLPATQSPRRPSCSLSITPLRKLTKQYWLIGVRRMIGLFAFFYGCLHFTTYIWLDKSFDVHEMIKDVYKRPFITAGFTAFVLLIPLALTSTKGWIRRLGKNWQRLHRLIYVTGIAAVIHYIWLVKADLRKPLQYAFVLGVLLIYRVAMWISEARRKMTPAARSPRAAEVTEA